jgi:hypothetical protein
MTFIIIVTPIFSFSVGIVDFAFFFGGVLYRPIISTGIWTQALHGKGARCHRGAIAFAGRALQGPGLRRPESKRSGIWKDDERCRK